MKLIKILDYFFLLRPLVLIPFWTFFLLGYYHARIYEGKSSFFITSFNPKLFPVLFIGTAFFGIIYIINQIFDKETDKINNKLFFIPKEIISIKNAYIESAILFIISAIIFYIYKIDVKIILLMLLLLLIGILYSVPPIRFKGRPVLDVFANCVLYGLLPFMIAWMIASSLSWKTVLYATPYFLAIAAEFINTTLADAKGDKLTGAITTGVWLGPKKGSLISFILLVLTIIISFYLESWICFIAAILSFPLFLQALITQREQHFLLSFQVAGGLFVLITAIVIPYYFLFLGAISLFTKWYYKKRFDFNYPSFGGGK